MKSSSKIIITVLMINSCVYAQNKVDIKDIHNPFFISINENGLFITEENSLAHYSPDKFELITHIEKNEDGSNIFKYPPMISLYKDYFFVNSFTKCAWIDYKEKNIKTKNYSEFEGFSSSTELMLFPIKDKYIRRIVDHDNTKQIFDLLDSDFNKIKNITEAYYDFTKIPDDIKSFKLLFHYTGIEVYKDKIYIGDTKKGFNIDVFDSDGNFLYKINKDANCKDVSQEFKDKALDEMKADAGYFNYLTRQSVEFYFYDKFPAFRYFLISDNKIYIFSYRMENNNHEVIILDLNGNHLKTIYLPLKSVKALKFTGSYDLLTIYNNKLYELIQDKETKKWELIITKL